MLQSELKEISENWCELTSIALYWLMLIVWVIPHGISILIFAVSKLTRALAFCFQLKFRSAWGELRYWKYVVKFHYKIW